MHKPIVGFDGESPGSGYYGKQEGRINGNKLSLPNDDEFPPQAKLKAMANAVLDDLIQHASESQVGFGGFVHVINHTAALAELAQYGYRDLS